MIGGRLGHRLVTLGIHTHEWQELAQCLLLRLAERTTHCHTVNTRSCRRTPTRWARTSHARTHARAHARARARTHAPDAPKRTAAHMHAHTRIDALANTLVAEHHRHRVNKLLVVSFLFGLRSGIHRHFGAWRGACLAASRLRGLRLPARGSARRVRIRERRHVLARRRA
jgi:hypothetical protein